MIDQQAGINEATKFGILLIVSSFGPMLFIIGWRLLRTYLHWGSD